MARSALWMGVLGQLLALVAGQVPQRQRPRVRVDSEVLGSLMGEVTLRCQLIRQTSEVIKVTRSREINGQKEEVAVYDPSYPHRQNRGRFAFRETHPKQDATLTIRSLTLQDGGIYFCTFFFSNWTEEEQTKLIVAVKPDNRAAAVPAVESLTERAVVATCTSAGGYPPATIQWLLAEFAFYVLTTETNNTDGTVTVQSQLWMTPAIQANNKTASCVISHKATSVPESLPVVLSIRHRNSSDQSILLWRRPVWEPMVSTWVCIGLLGAMAVICFTIFYAVYQRSSSWKAHDVQADARGDTELDMRSSKV